MRGNELPLICCILSMILFANTILVLFLSQQLHVNYLSATVSDVRELFGALN